jgi:aspartyl aminopeptidase
MSESLKKLLSFLDASPTPFHAVESLKIRLLEAGFEELREYENWSIHPGSKNFVVRGGTSIAAWIQGIKLPSDSGFRLIGAHTDSPNLQIKPQPDLNQHG